LSFDDIQKGSDGGKQHRPRTRKKWFCYGNKIKDNNFFFAATKNFAAATKLFVDRTKHFFVVTKYFIPILTNDFVGITKPFIP